jgi:peptidoglycan/LPS O-acetylase OafA/YrhL
MDGVRGVAALCVMIYHFTQNAGFRVFPSGPIAVDIFFCLSGFVIANSYAARLDAGLTLPGFARIRFIRLYPMYFLGLVLGIVNFLLMTFLGGLGGEVATSVRVALYGLLILPTFGRFPVGLGADRTDHFLFPLNAPSWSLFFELLSNALFVVLRPRGLTLALLLIALAALFVDTALVYDQPCGWGSTNVLGGFPRAFFAFYLGTALRQLWGIGALRVPRRLALLAPLLTLFVCCAPDDTRWFIASVLIATPAIVSLATAEPRSAVARRAFALLGEISYPLYAIHLPAFGIMKLAVNRISGSPLDTPPPPVASLALAIGLVALCLALSRLYDQPARRKLTALLTFAARAGAARNAARAAS